MIREAKKADAREIAELSYIIWKDMELEIVEKYSETEVVNAIQQSITEIPYRNNYQHIHIYEIENKVAGMIIAYRGDKELAYEHAWADLDSAKYLTLSTNTPLPVKEAEDKTIYIESIATFPKYRGRGIAKKLMKHIIDKYEGETLSLNCDQTNHLARNFYEKMGFEVTKQIQLYGHDYDYMRYQN